MSKKIALFGLSADPFHLGHAACIKACKTELPNHVFVIMPCKINPLGKVDKFGNEILPMNALQRFNMLQNFFKNDPSVIVSNYEIEKSGPSYTIDTIEYLKHMPFENLGSRNPSSVITAPSLNQNNNEITLIIGSDNFLQLHKWHRWKDILNMSRILILKRKGKMEVNIHTINNDELKIAFLNGLRKNTIRIFDGPQIDVSSSMIRQRLQEGASKNELLSYLPQSILEAYAKH